MAHYFRALCQAGNFENLNPIYKTKSKINYKRLAHDRHPRLQKNLLPAVFSFYHCPSIKVLSFIMSKPNRPLVISI